MGYNVTLETEHVSCVWKSQLSVNGCLWTPPPPPTHTHPLPSSPPPPLSLSVCLSVSHMPPSPPLPICVSSLPPLPNKAAFFHFTPPPLHPTPPLSLSLSLSVCFTPPPPCPLPVPSVFLSHFQLPHFQQPHYPPPPPPPPTHLSLSLLSPSLCVSLTCLSLFLSRPPSHTPFLPLLFPSSPVLPSSKPTPIPNHVDVWLGQAQLSCHVNQQLVCCGSIDTHFQPVEGCKHVRKAGLLKYISEVY